MLPARFAPILFGFLVSGIMSCIVTGVATLRTVGFGRHTFSQWMEAWVYGWPTAFVVILVVAPLLRRFVERLVSPKG